MLGTLSEDISIFIFALVIAIVIGIALQWSVGILPLKDVKTKTPIVPDTTINCVNGVCDTVYVYKFK